MAVSSAESTTIARPYAEALFKRAKETNTLDEWSAMLGFLATVASDRRTLGLFANPQVTKDQLTELLLGVGEGVLSEEGENLVRLVVQNDRAGALPEIARLYEQHKATHESRVDVVVTAAYSVTAAQRKKLADALKAKLGKEVRVSTHKDTSLIGGAIIRAGDWVIDGSVKGHLRDLASSLNS